MHLFKTNLIDFIDALLGLFKDNRNIYKRLIQYHHQVQNTLEEDELLNIATNFFSQEKIKNMIASQNHKIMEHTNLEFDFELLWEACTSSNKTCIWKWINTIVDTLELYV